MPSISDPRLYPMSSQPASDDAIGWQALVDDAAAAPGIQQRAALEAALEQSIAAVLARRDVRSVRTVRDALESARSAAGYRQLWRAVIAAWRSLSARSGASVVAHGFAIPVVIVAGGEQDCELPMTIREPQPIVDAMREQGALAGNRNFGIGSVLVGERWVGLDATVAWPRAEAIGEIGGWIDALPAAPVQVVAGRESAHLRWVPGSALADPSTDLFTERHSGKWGLKAADSMSRGFSAEGAQVLALPGAPNDILSAWQQGLLAHREVALQLFAASTLRNLRAAFGEPAAVISAHRAGSGELRISLSSPFGERDAEGFRCPLYPFERIDDVLKSIVDLLDACRLTDVTVLPGMHADRDRGTGLPLFFRADRLPDQNIVQL